MHVYTTEYAQWWISQAHNHAKQLNTGTHVLFLAFVLLCLWENILEWPVVKQSSLNTDFWHAHGVDISATPAVMDLNSWNRVILCAVSWRCM